MVNIQLYIYFYIRTTTKLQYYPERINKSITIAVIEMHFYNNFRTINYCTRTYQYNKNKWDYIQLQFIYYRHNTVLTDLEFISFKLRQQFTHAIEAVLFELNLDYTYEEVIETGLANIRDPSRSFRMLSTAQSWHFPKKNQCSCSHPDVDETSYKV